MPTPVTSVRIGVAVSEAEYASWVETQKKLGYPSLTAAIRAAMGTLRDIVDRTDELGSEHERCADHGCPSEARHDELGLLLTLVGREEKE